jgi:hypothetical protein
VGATVKRSSVTLSVRLKWNLTVVSSTLEEIKWSLVAKFSVKLNHIIGVPRKQKSAGEAKFEMASQSTKVKVHMHFSLQVQRVRSRMVWLAISGL